MENKIKLKKGDKVWVQFFGRNKESIEQTYITKIGTKYFEVDKVYRTKFEKETGKQITEYQQTYKIWFSIDDYKIEQECNVVRKIVTDYFDRRSNVHKLSLQQLQQIKEIICAPSEHSKILSDGGKNGGIIS